MEVSARAWWGEGVRHSDGAGRGDVGVRPQGCKLGGQMSSQDRKENWRKRTEQGKRGQKINMGGLWSPAGTRRTEARGPAREERQNGVHWDRTSQQRWTGTARPEMLQERRGAGRLRKDLWPEEVGCRLSSEGPLPGDQGAKGGGHRQ